jgi:protoporphyrinogen/coproporphyrinogen III oxidase
MAVDVVDVAIVGGGIAGLSAAYELARRSVSFVVLEQAPRAGGVVLSEEIDGFTIDAGPDSLLIQKPDGIRLCEELGLGDRLVATLPPRLAYIQRHGKLYPLPAASVLGIPTRAGPFIRTGLFSWAGKLRMGAELFVPPRRGGGDESIGAFMTRRFGREATTYLAEPLLAGIHAGDVDRLSLRALFPRFAEAEQSHGSLIRAFRQRPATRSDTGAFKSLPGGLSELVRALTAALPPGALRLAATVVRLAPNRGAGTHTLEMMRGPALECRAVVLAAPAYATAAIVRDFDSELARRCAAIPYASIATVVLAFPREAIAHPLNGSGYVVPRTERSAVLAATWLSSKWPHRAPAGQVLVRAFVGGARDPAALERPDADLVDRALASMQNVLGIRGRPSFARVYRFNRSSPQHEVGHLDRIKAIDEQHAHPGVFLTGSGFRGVGIPDCIADARAIAAKAAAWLASQSTTTELTENKRITR